MDDPLVVYEGAGVSAANRRHLFADHQGSIISLSDANGALLAINRYDDWGTPDATNLGRFQYTGQAWIPELGLYHYKARIYSPTLGRFLQTDPIGYEDQQNLYAYVGNDPVNKIDPTGNEQESPYAILRRLRDRVVDVVVNTVKEDPGILLDGAMIVADVATVPSGEAAVGIALRRGANEAGERLTRREADFVVSNDGVAVRNSAAGARADLEGAGMAGRPSTGSSEHGTIHTVPARGGREAMDVRVMDGSASHPPRVVTTRAGTNDPVQPSGRQFPSGTPKQQRRDGCHINLGRDC